MIASWNVASAECATSTPAEPGGEVKSVSRSLYYIYHRTIVITDLSIIDSSDNNMQVVSSNNRRSTASLRRRGSRRLAEVAGLGASGFPSTKHSKCPPRRSARSVCPCGDPWGTPLQVQTNHSWAPRKAPEGTNAKVTSANGHFCAYPTHIGVSRVLARRVLDEHEQK